MKVYMVYMPVIKDEDGNIASFIKEVYSNKAAAYDAMRDTELHCLEPSEHMDIMELELCDVYQPSIDPLYGELKYDAEKGIMYLTNVKWVTQKYDNTLPFYVNARLLIDKIEEGYNEDETLYNNEE